MIREMIEEWEKEYLSPYASLSKHSKGRDRAEEQCDIRPVYQRDRDRILHSKAFRRLKDKTQVFLTPEGAHYRTRLTHTLEVSQNARLIEAIALGHDLGHTPFGHAGERALNRVCPLGFAHHKQSVRMVELLEKGGTGLNLTWEVRDGILNHKTSTIPSTLEGKIVRLSDKIAYIHHDMDDAIRGKILTEKDVPKRIGKLLGMTARLRLDSFIHDIVSASSGKNDICMSPQVEEAMRELRRFMFLSVYENNEVKKEEAKAERLVETLYQYFMDYPMRMSQEFIHLIEEKGEPTERVVCDYIASMTDRFAIAKYNELFIPDSWHG